MYVRGSAEQLPFADASFDAALACLVFEHLPDHRPPIAEIARVLAPGGRFVFFLNHPLLQAPNSGWVIDHILEEQYWRIGPYLARRRDAWRSSRPACCCRSCTARCRSTSTRWPSNGLLVERMEEPAPPEGFLAKADEYRAAATIPRLLLLVARKH